MPLLQCTSTTTRADRRGCLADGAARWGEGCNDVVGRRVHGVGVVGCDVFVLWREARRFDEFFEVEVLAGERGGSEAGRRAGRALGALCAGAAGGGRPSRKAYLDTR
jgi:hypothetical protein